MVAGTALYVCLLVYAGVSLFIINGLYVYMVVCVFYAYNLTTRKPVGFMQSCCFVFVGILSTYK